jgi:hypothetical protein
MVLPFAHAGHWAIYALYAVPFIIVGFSIITTIVRERRESGPSQRDRT